jgi:hypothetical protein
MTFSILSHFSTGSNFSINLPLTEGSINYSHNKNKSYMSSLSHFLTPLNLPGMPWINQHNRLDFLDRVTYSRSHQLLPQQRYILYVLSFPFFNSFSTCLVRHGSINILLDDILHPFTFLTGLNFLDSVSSHWSQCPGAVHTLDTLDKFIQSPPSTTFATNIHLICHVFPIF